MAIPAVKYENFIFEMWNLDKSEELSVWKPILDGQDLQDLRLCDIENLHISAITSVHGLVNTF